LGTLSAARPTLLTSVTLTASGLTSLTAAASEGASLLLASVLVLASLLSLESWPWSLPALSTSAASRPNKSLFPIMLILGTAT
jgi:hypothetical protein